MQNNFSSKINISFSKIKKMISVRPAIIRFFAIFMVITISILIQSFFYVPLKETNPISGVIDITDISDYSNTLISLNSGWIKSDNAGKKSITTPNELLNKKSEKSETCTIQIKVHPNNNFFGIVLPKIDCPYSIKINNKMYYNNGITETGQLNPAFRKLSHLEIIYFPCNVSKINISLTLGAHKENNTVLNNFYFGSDKIANKQYMNILSSDILLFTVMFSLFIYFMLLACYDKKQNIYISFTIICFLCMIRIAFMNNAAIGSFFPGISYELAELIPYVASPLTTLFILIHTYQLFPNYINTKTYNILKLIYIVLIGISMYYTDSITNYMHDIFTVLSSFTLCFIIYVGFNAIVNKEAGAMNFYISAIILLLMSLQNETPFVSNEHKGYIVSLGFIIFAILQIISFLENSSNTMQRETYLSKTYDESITNLRNEETNFLSSHLKPHFLFNALNIISGYALFDPENSKLVVTSLITYLKQLFEHDNLNEMNTLENEIALLKAFGHIEHERFPEIELNYEINCKNLDILVPALILQPLLENSVNHGIRKQSNPSGLISVKITDNESFVSISINDNGLGMNNETIQKALSKPTDNKFHSLYHLQLRLKELYNEKLNIKSIPGKGTLISFNIPYSLPSQQ